MKVAAAKQKEVKTMEYKGFEVTEENNAIRVEQVQDFDPVHIFECGQCFRWSKEEDGSYTGIVRGKAVNIRVEGGSLYISNASFEDFKEIWHHYFDLGRNYEEIKEILSKDPIMAEAIQFGWGMRILQQDFWETLISFIISSNSNIPKIKKTIDILSREFGREIKFNGKFLYTFPDAEALSNASIHHLSICRGGYRCEYIFKTSNRVRQGLVRWDHLKDCAFDEARKELSQLSGVGPKVADCVLLFSGTRSDVFPTDVWVKRVMEELYFKREASIKEIQDFSRQRFGSLAGFAQQYLFYYAREKKIGVRNIR